jgi:hypothetical protein
MGAADLVGLLVKALTALLPLILAEWAGRASQRLTDDEKTLEVCDAQLRIASCRPGSIDAAVRML